MAFDLSRLEYAGAAIHDPLGALLFCAPTTCDLSVINGRVVVERGEIVGFDLEAFRSRLQALGFHPVGQQKYYTVDLRMYNDAAFFEGLTGLVMQTMGQSNRTLT